MKQKHSLKLLLVCISVSIFLHLLAAYSFGPPPVKPPELSQQKQTQDEQGQQDKKNTIWVSTGITPCDSYEGIGVQFNSLTGIVSHAASGAPAYNAGIRIGDELITPLWNMKLTFGQVLDIEVLRNGKKLNFIIIVDRICHE
jgi:hypothetical protein